MTEASGQLFSPGQAPGGIKVVIGQVGGTLRLEGIGLDLRVPVLAMTLKSGGFDGRHWQLEWPADNGQIHALVLSPGATTDRLLTELPEPLAGQLATQRGRGRASACRFRLGVTLVGAVVLLPFAVLLAFWLYADPLAGWAAGQVGIERESQLGALAFAQTRPSLKLVEQGPAVELVKAIGNRLTAGSAYTYQWFVAANPEVNAFALPGGYVVVHTGLLRAADNAEEVAGVLAHEVQHVELRHSLRNLIHGLGWRAALGLARGDLSGGVWMGLADQLGKMRYSRELERQADLGGLESLRKAGISPEGMPTFFAKLARQGEQGTALLSSHPASAERMQTLRQAIAARGGYPADRLPYDWPAFKAALATP